MSHIYAARKSSNNKLSKNHKISPDTNPYKKYTNIKNKLFEEFVPSVLPLLKKHIRLRHAGIVDQFRRFINTRFKKKKKSGKKEEERNGQKQHKILTNII